MMERQNFILNMMARVLYTQHDETLRYTQALSKRHLQIEGERICVNLKMNQCAFERNQCASMPHTFKIISFEKPE